ncbi:MAG TPA: hypothetical protein VFV10_04580 [Gammaproteobacteria bacterium]|nr:hypothetical protein [Gammaproteobacteria bacterium]
MKRLRDRMLLEAGTARPRSIDARAVGLADFVPLASPQLDKPTHLAPYVTLLERALSGEPVRAVVAAPPQHGKTTVAQHAFVWGLLRNGRGRHAYVTFQQTRSGEVARETAQIAVGAGLDGIGNRKFLRSAAGGSVLWTSIDGGITGYPVDGLCLVDDPFADENEARSKIIRDRKDSVLRSAILPRLHRHASCIVMATRWHPDDLSGRLVAEGWEYLRIPAIAEDDDPLGRAPGEPLAPARFPLDVLERRRKDVGEYTWAALYQGRPRPRGGTVFREPAYYDELPKSGYRVGFGLDLAYTAKTHADYSVLVELWRDGDRYYVVDVRRAQVDAPAFTLTLKARSVQRPGVRMRWDASGTEAGAAAFIRKAGVPIDVHQAKGDPFMRVQEVAAAWNDGRVMVPRPLDPATGEGVEASWLAALLDELLNFTGVHDQHDDQAVALASAFASLQTATRVFSGRGDRPKPRE